MFSLKYKICFILILLHSFLLADYITKFGKDIISASDLIIKCSYVGFLSMPKGGGKIAIFNVEGTIKGKIELKKRINVLYTALPGFESENLYVLVLKSLKSQHLFEPIAEFSLKEKDGQAKLNVLEKITALESILDENQKIKLYFDYCLTHLKDQNGWVREHAFKEWIYLTKKASIQFEMIETLKKIYEEIPEEHIKEQLKKDIVEIEKSNILKDKAILKKIENSIKKSINLTNSKEISKRIEALNWLYLFPTSKSFAIFIQALNDDSEDVRCLAIFYLGLNKEKRALEHLKKIAKNDHSERVRKSAIRALKLLGN